MARAIGAPPRTAFMARIQGYLSLSPALAGLIVFRLGIVQEQLEAGASTDPKKLLDALAAGTTKYLKEYE